MRRNRLRQRNQFFHDAEEINPMEGAVNIVDAMLVFACGLMLSLVIYWNVDLRTQDFVPVSASQDVSDVEKVQEGIENEDASSEGYVRLGTVYQDPETGELYMAEDAADVEDTGTVEDTEAAE